MRQFVIGRNEMLTPSILTSILLQYQSAVRPLLQKRYDYYMGKQQILLRPTSDDKPSNKVVTNFVKNIVENYEGYALGIPVKYGRVDDRLVDILDYNDKDEEDAELFRNGLVYGRGAEICYVDKEGQTRFKYLDPRTVVPIYSDDLEEELLYVVRFWKTKFVDEVEKYRVEVYDSKFITYYDSTPGFTSFKFIDQKQHFFNQVPITIFSINTEETALTEQIFSLQDAYNNIMSDLVDDQDQFADAYLVLRGYTADDDDLASMKRNRVLMLDNDGGADYLIKDQTKVSTDSLLNKIEEKIREMGTCPNFSDSETFNSTSGIAIRYKLLGMENIVSGILNRFEKALRRRIELLCSIENLKDDADWRDVEINFTRNIPSDVSYQANIVNQLRGVVSTETLLGQLSFVKDPVEEALKVEEEKLSNMELYQFTSNDDEEVEE